MCEKEINKRNSERVLAIQPLIKQLRKEAQKIESDIQQGQSKLNSITAQIKEAKRVIKFQQNKHDEENSNLNQLSHLLEQRKKETKALEGELEELLKPYEAKLVKMKDDLSRIEEETVASLRKKMISVGWTEEDCRVAAKNYAVNHVDWSHYQYCQMILERIKKCDYDERTQSQHGVIADLFNCK